MPLPDLIEIVPLKGPVHAEITVPGSKSITNRALILAALADGETTLRGALWSEDTEVMTAALRDLGFKIEVEADPDEACNRTIRVQGLGGRIPRSGTPEKPLELFVGNAGTSARFLAAMVCLNDGVYRLHGVPRMHERPQAALFAALRELGYRVDSPNDKLPAVIYGQAQYSEQRTRRCQVSVSKSSQFASALLLCAKHGGWDIEVTGANADELPYVEMTRELVSVFPMSSGTFRVEPDASSGSYFWAGDWLLNWSARAMPSAVNVRDWPKSRRQIDEAFPQFLPLKTSISRATDLGDSIMTTIVVSADYDAGVSSVMCLEKQERVELHNERPTFFKFTDLGRLRVQECERVVALRTELTKCGAKVIEEGDTLTVYPSELHGAEIETYNDHRMAMCFAVLGLKVPGIKLRNPSCVKKTFPNFFQKLAAPPPHGLGATILNAHTGERPEHQDLFAA